MSIKYVIKSNGMLVFGCKCVYNIGGDENNYLYIILFFRYCSIFLVFVKVL